MIALGFDVFSLATNHVFDKGEAGLASAYNFFAENPSVTAVGLHKKDEDIIKVVEKNGIKIAFVNYTYLTNGFSHPANTAYQVPLADYKNGCTEMVKTIREAKTRADFVVCCVHWGEEYQNTPNAIQKESAKLLADSLAKSDSTDKAQRAYRKATLHLRIKLLGKIFKKHVLCSPFLRLFIMKSGIKSIKKFT